jgi:shikimate kinase
LRQLESPLLELEYLHKTFTLENTVISCGGGTPCFFDNMEKMNEKGITVWLKATPPEILKRVIKEKEKRPLLKNIDSSLLLIDIETKLAERTPFYNKASINFFAEKDEILNFISTFAI